MEFSAGILREESRLLLRRVFSSCFPGECSEATLPGGSSSLALPSLRKRTLGLGWVDNSNSLHWQYCVFQLWLWTALEFLFEQLFCNWDPLNLSMLDVENHTLETFSYPRKAATELGNDRWMERAALLITWESAGNPCWDHSVFCRWANRWRGLPAGSDSEGCGTSCQNILQLQLNNLKESTERQRASRRQILHGFILH